MKIIILCIGKKSKSYIEQGIETYVQRIKRHFDIETKWIDVINKSSKHFNYESSLLKEIEEKDWLIVLDECGEQYDSVSFSKNFQQWVNLGKKKLIFLIGGPYGLSKNIKNRANIILSLSKMTFTHQMVQLFLVEQIYRAITLINGENYHH